MKSEFIFDSNFTLNEIEDLTRLCFHSNHYVNNFPQVFKESNFKSFFLIRYRDKPVSFCTLYPSYFLYNNQLIKAFCLGSVCTHPEFRQKGLAASILQKAELMALELSAHFLYLFSNKNILYDNAGYTLCGKTYIANILEKNNKLKLLKELNKIVNKYSDIHIDFVESKEKYDYNFQSKIWSFLLQNSSACESILSYQEFSDILKIKNLNILVLTQSQNIAAVAFVNKGDDFKDVLHGIYFINTDFAILLLNYFLNKVSNKAHFYFFPGIFFKFFENIFNYQILPAMYVKSLHDLSRKGLNSVTLIEEDKLHVRSLQGT